MHYPVIAPRPPRLSELGAALERVEASGCFSNYGPETRAFEAAATQRLFGGRGATLAVANATLGLMIALADAVGARAAGRMALMPALTFAATAQSAWWAGLVPLICDVAADDWGACPRDEERLLRLYGDRIAAIVPYATFGRAIDLDRYAWLARRHDVAIVIDAAASLGTRDAAGIGFGAGRAVPGGVLDARDQAVRDRRGGPHPLRRPRDDRASARDGQFRVRTAARRHAARIERETARGAGGAGAGAARHVRAKLRDARCGGRRLSARDRRSLRASACVGRASGAGLSILAAAARAGAAPRRDRRASRRARRGQRALFQPPSRPAAVGARRGGDRTDPRSPTMSARGC